MMFLLTIYNFVPDAIQKNVSKKLVLLTVYKYACFTYYKSETKIT